MITCHTDYPLLSHNTFGLDVRCRQFVEYTEAADLAELVGVCQNEPILHIGRGSNLLFLEDFDGVVFHSLITGVEYVGASDETCLLKVGAGMEWDAFVVWCVENGCYGLENLSYIPGEVGAAAVQNIGAYGVEVADFIECVHVFDWQTGHTVDIPVACCDYAYRHSRFKGTDSGRFVVTHVTFRLNSSFAPKLEYGGLRNIMSVKGISEVEMTALQLRQLIIEIRRSKLPEVGDLGSAGSFFMNPVVTVEKANELLENNPAMPHYAVGDMVKIPAAWLIEQCGWKGRTIGNVGVYARQPLVIVNLGGASGEEIAALSRQVQEDVRNRFGVKICPEVNFIGNQK